MPAILREQDLTLTGAVARSTAGEKIGDVVVHAGVDEALERGADVFVDYTAPGAVKANVLAAIAHGVHAVIGTSGLTDADYEELDRAARAKNVGVLAAGNFAISAVLLAHFAELAARYMPTWEVIDYADAAKPDAPSGTARELVHRLASVGRPKVEVPIESTIGAKEARGWSVNGMQVHSIRVPGFMIGLEAIFGRPEERLSLRYDGGAGAEPYIGGTLLAIRRVHSFSGVRRGLAHVLDLR